VAVVSQLLIAWVITSQNGSFLAETEFKTVAVSPLASSGSESAALDEAWKVLTAFDEYGEWNSFTFGVTSSSSSPPQPGSPVVLQVSLGCPWPISRFITGRTTMTLDFFWLVYDENAKTMCWGIRNEKFPIFDRMLHSNRCAFLRFVEVGDYEGHVQIRHEDENLGFLAPLVGYIYKDAIENGFRDMTHDFSKRLAQRKLLLNK
jgi:hypothetical protein